MVLRKSFRVWRKYRPRSVLMESKDVSDQALLFESNTVAVLSPIELDIIRRECNYGDSVSAYGCLGVLSVDYEQETYQYLVVITECLSLGKIQDAEVFKITQTAFIPLSIKANLELVQEVGKLLASGKFYFSYPSYGVNFDLLACAQKQGKEQPQFYWNRSLRTYLDRFGVVCSKWLFRVMCGNIEIQTVYAGDKKTKMCLFSRLSCERAGTRLNVRGMNDDGHVANFVETELAIYVDNSVASFVQIRGLVPLFWEQPGIQTGGGMIRIKFSRGYACSHPSFERHFERCLLHYGPLLCCNLLGERNQEQLLSNSFQEHFAELSSAYCGEMVCYDYHKIIKSGNSNIETTLSQSLLPLVNTFLSSHGIYHCGNGQPMRLQTGTIRTNCLDCLDRTNSVQNFLSQHVLPTLLSALGLSVKSTVVSRFKQLLGTAWTRNGDNLSILYSGTRALSFEGKANKLKGGARSVKRTIKNNFMDSNKQEAINMLLLSNAYSGDLGHKSRALLDQSDVLSSPLPFKAAVCERWSDFTHSEKLRVASCTWNVNGGKLIRSIALRGNQSLDDWLLDGPVRSGAVKEHPEEFATPPDIYAIGFEELVGLTASNIVSASSSNRREWGVELQKVLSRDTPYELLTAEQLVGVCLYIFIRPQLIPYIRDVAVSTVKTGMSGTAGNKGGVAIRFLLHSTSLCFVCSHFAAHQHKVIERNHDFAEICRKVSFPHGQTLDSHDYVFWCGDFNYRVDLPTHSAKDHIANQRWDRLVKQDQLIKQKRAQKVFQGYIEGEMTFAPTYKYDQFSDDYDTSEKCRTPAWCDRVLWKRKLWGKRIAKNGSRSQLLVSTVDDKGEADSLATPHDFGIHPCDAVTVCGSEVGGGGKEDLVTIGHQWHPGRLLYYNRAELKQSDHRPVIALIEVDIYQVDPARRSQVRDEVTLSLGPLDPTVVVQEMEEGGEISVPHLLESLRTYGEVVLVRVTDDSILITFRKSTSALAATGLHGNKVNGVCVSVSLRVPWPPGTEDTSVPTPQPGKGRFIRRPTVSVLTSELLGIDTSGLDEGEDLMEFSFDEQGVPDSTTDLNPDSQDVQSDSDLLELESDSNEPELDLSSSSSETDLQASGMSELPVPHIIHISASEPVIHKPQRPMAPPRRPVIPPRPGNSSVSSLQEVERDVHPVPKPRSHTVSDEGGAGTKFNIGPDDPFLIDLDPQGHAPELTIQKLSPDVNSHPKRPIRPPRPNAPNRQRSVSPSPPTHSSIMSDNSTPPNNSPLVPSRPMKSKQDNHVTKLPIVPKRPDGSRPSRPPPPRKT